MYKIHWHRIVAAMICAAPLTPLAFQTPQNPPTSNEFTLSTDVNLVILDAGVKDTRGGYVSGLVKENFRVYDNGKIQTINHFTNADIPVTVGLVMDNSGSMRSKRNEVSTAALNLVRASNPRDEVFVVNFNDSVRRGLPVDVLFTDNIGFLRAGLLNGTPEGRTSLYDALAYSLMYLEKGKMDKKTLVVVSDGGDNASTIGFAELMRRVQQSRATIYTIGIFDEDDSDRNPDALRKLAGVSGGEYYQLNKLEEIAIVCRKVASDIRTRYTIAYIPQPIESRDPVRSIKVTASESSHKKLIVRTRTRYRAPERVSGKEGK
jgi:VWFA-related protein